MDSVKSFIQKHKWLLIIWTAIDFIIIFLPQWLDAIWDLAEKIEGRQITMPHPNIIWVYWITVPVGIIMFGIAIWAVKSTKPPKVKEQIVEKSESLTDTLTAMHRRLGELQKEKANSFKVNYKQFEMRMPLLANVMGTVKLKEWHAFERKLESRIRKAIPPQPIPRYSYSPRRNFMEWSKWKQRVYLVGIAVAQEVRGELFESKKWTLADGNKLSDWIDGTGWGIKELRDKDPQWNSNRESITHYLTDSKLCELIGQHIDFSTFYHNQCLIVSYSKRFAKTSFSMMLHEALVDSPISLEKTERALGEINHQIEQRLLEMASPHPSPIQYPKPEMHVKIPSSPLTPAVNIYRASYISGELPILRVDYVASSTEVLANFEREAKLRIQKGDMQADILPVKLFPSVSGTVTNTAEYRIPESFRGEITVVPIVILGDGTQANTSPYRIDI